VDGVRLSALLPELRVSRGSVFEIIRTLGIKTENAPGPGGRGRVALISGRDVERLKDACRRVHAKEVKIADLASGLQRQRTQRTMQTRSTAASAYSADPADPAPFLARLEAANRAVRSGLGLTTNETAWILGVQPGSSPITRGGITATKTGWNCWRLQSAESADDARQ